MMLEYWKRTEKQQAMEWGTVGYDVTELDRVEFKPSEKIPTSFIDGSKDMRYFDPKIRDRLMYQSAILVFIMICGAVGVVSSIYVMRAQLTLVVSDSTAQIAVSIVNAIQIYVFNYLYGKAAEALTARENHRTDTAHENSLVAKFFVFQFVNSYSSFFYISFVAAHMARPVTT